MTDSALTEAERADIRRRFDEGERAIREHDRGECDVCDEFRRLDAEDLRDDSGRQPKQRGTERCQIVP